MRQTTDTSMTLAGIDGGGTSTRLALAHGDGTVFGYAETGCCSFVELGREGAKKVFQQLWQSAWKSAGSPSRPADALFIGTGSILSSADALINCELARSLGLAGPNGKVNADNDACNALAGALSGRQGLLLISGTGSVCYGRNDAGETWRAGGWGALLDDRGSAYALASAALVAVTRAADGRAQPTELTACLLEKLELRDLKEIYRKLHEEDVSRAEIAALAPQVVAVAEAGDAVAGNILDEGATGLVEMVIAVAGRLGLERSELALTGGLITNAAPFRRRFLDRLASKLPEVTLVEAEFAPVFGAVMLACQNATGAPPTSVFLDNLRRSIAELKLN